MMDETSVSVPLAETIRVLGAEFYRAMVHDRDEKFRFAPGEVKLEFQKEVSSEASADVRIMFGVTSIAVKSSASETRTHTIKFTLIPELQSGSRVLVSDAEGEWTAHRVSLRRRGDRRWQFEQHERH